MVEETRRGLTTIVAADIAGFSRLIGADEEGTLVAQRAHRNELIQPRLEEYNGRVANTAGDSFLFEFPSVVEAVRCSIAVQDGMVERNQGIASDQKIRFRIGINLGDVVADGDDLLGDGVKIAARLLINTDWKQSFSTASSLWPSGANLSPHGRHVSGPGQTHSASSVNVQENITP